MNTCPNTFSRKSCLTSNPDRSTTASPRVNRSQRKNHRLKPLELPSFKVISRPPRGFLSTREPFFPTFWTRNSRRDSDHPPSLPLSVLTPPLCIPECICRCTNSRVWSIARNRAKNRCINKQTVCEKRGEKYAETASVENGCTLPSMFPLLLN